MAQVITQESVVVAPLLTKCIDCFQLIESGCDLFHLTNYGVQQLKLMTWAQSIGAIGSLTFNTNLDNNLEIKKALLTIQRLLEKDDDLVGIYGLELLADEHVTQTDPILNEMYITFQALSTGPQKHDSKANVKWRIQDSDKFSNLVDLLTGLIDKIVSMTASIEVLSNRRNLLQDEIKHNAVISSNKRLAPFPSLDDTLVSNGLRRVKKELDNISELRSSPINAISLQDSLDDILGWFEGPIDTPYEGGIFFIRMHLGYYPFRPPICKLLNKIHHPNIDQQGRICMDLLAEMWCPALTISTLLLSIQSLLDDPNEEDPLVPMAAEMYRNDRERYNMIARSYTKDFAFRRIPDLKSTENGAPWYHGLQFTSVGQSPPTRNAKSPASEAFEARFFPEKHGDKEIVD